MTNTNWRFNKITNWELYTKSPVIIHNCQLITITVTYLNWTHILFVLKAVTSFPKYCSKCVNIIQTLYDLDNDRSMGLVVGL
jgi:hypothetical protein